MSDQHKVNFFIKLKIENNTDLNLLIQNPLIFIKLKAESKLKTCNLLFCDYCFVVIRFKSRNVSMSTICRRGK